MSNRARLIVMLDGPWRLYQRTAPPGWEILGTVQAGDEIGALLRNRRTGAYCRANAGAIRSLPQRKAQAALDAARTD